MSDIPNLPSADDPVMPEPPTDEEIRSMLLTGPEYDDLPDHMRIDPMLYVPKPVDGDNDG